MKNNILITGMPKSGKTTLLKKLISDYPNRVGFVTNEIRVDGIRTGFEIESSTGEKSTLASVDFDSDLRVGKYGVDVGNLEKTIPEVTRFSQDDLLYLDEIGQMELCSKEFQDLVITYLNASNVFIATFSQVYRDDFMREIIKRPDVQIVEISENDRGGKCTELKLTLENLRQG